MPYTYPAAPATTSDATTIEVHHLMKTPGVIARRLRTVLEQRYIADFLLQGRFTAVGGSILYETGESIFTTDDPAAVTPGAGYPQTPISAGELAAAKTVKWGQDVPITDEAIARLGMDPVERAFTKLANRNVEYVDSAALAVIASQVTATYNTTAGGAPGAWTDGDKIIAATLEAKAQVMALNEGYDPNTVVLKDAQWAKVISRLISAGLLPREGVGNPVLTGSFPTVLGLTWVATPNTPTTNPLLVDNTQLGGMADEDLGGPGYVRSGGIGVEVKSIRQDETDSYLLRARRVTVPVVLEPGAGVFITNTGL